MNTKPDLTFYEFFAGGGMARIGLGDRWKCLFANDFDKLKAQTYRANFDDAEDHFRQCDVWELGPEDLPGKANLAWASSPCQDFSLAGARAGLSGGRSSAFFGFWTLMERLNQEGRAPNLIVIENVVGLLTSNKGADFAALCEALAREGYDFGALEIDAAAFSPQSRPRVFVIASKSREPGLEGPSPFQTKAIRNAYERLPEPLKQRWISWRLSAPPVRNTRLADLLEPDDAVRWRTQDETSALLAQMDARNSEKVNDARRRGERVVGAVYRRIRKGEQRAEVRFDDLAGCLRTPRGGSSRQLLLMVERGQTRSRWLTAREAARLMGLPEHYVLPRSQSAGLHVMGDGVSAQVVRHLAENLLEPVQTSSVRSDAA